MNNRKSTKTGYMVIAHGALAGELLNVLTFIAGPQPSFCAIALDHALDVEKARKTVMDAVDKIMGEEGVIILTDIFGGGPSNIALSLIDERPIEIVAGVNLPMLIHAATMDDGLPIREKAQKLREYGKNNIFIASEVLSGKR